MTLRSMVLWLALAAAPSACNGNQTTPDGSDGTPNDTVTTMEGGDVAPTDGPVDAHDGGDGGPALMCNALPVENLNALGTVMNGKLDYMGDNHSTSNVVGQGVQVASTLQGTAAQPGPCFFRIMHQRVFAYTAQTNSVLRISTSNPGTDPFFDTVLYIVDPTQSAACSAHPAGTTGVRPWLGCNDDDFAYGGDQRRISSTTVTVKQVNAGQTVYIAFGGFAPTSGSADESRTLGQFELTVEELAPVAASGACDTARYQSPCADGNSCVGMNSTSAMGTCQADGTVAGSACTSAGACTGQNLVCNNTSGFCVAQNVPDGMQCDAFHTCGSNSTCVVAAAGSALGTCMANGGAVNANCDSTLHCDSTMGLACDVDNGNVCRIAITSPATGATCNAFSQACPQNTTTPAMNQDCVLSSYSGLAGTCTQTATTAGTHCTSTCSGTNVTCNTMVTPGQCQTTAMPGQACNPNAQCASGSTCYLNDLDNIYDGTCFADGMLGGSCSTTCGTGLACSDMLDPTQGRCGNMVADGASCGLTDVCPTGDTCVQDPSMTGFHGTCRADGTAVGARCRRMPSSTMMACDNGMTCSAWIPEEGVCQQMSTNGSCDVRTGTTRCPSGQVCAAHTITANGSCVAPTAEVEPNDSTASAMTFTAPGAATGSLPFGDIDCYGVSVPANGKLFAMAMGSSGRCTGDFNVNVDVYALDATHNNYPTLLGSVGNGGGAICPRIEGGDTANLFPWAVNSGSSAVTWYVCVRSADTTGRTLPEYVLSIATN